MDSASWVVRTWPHFESEDLWEGRPYRITGGPTHLIIRR